VRANNLLHIVMILGVTVAVIGLFVVATAWPGTSVDATEFPMPDASETGSRVGTMIGFGLTGVGGLMALFSIIGWGVKFGTIAASVPVEAAES
jgi:uncharacterized membrane protein